MNKSSAILVAALVAAIGPWVAGPAAAAPIGSPLMLQSAAGPLVETVQYRPGWRGGYRGGVGAGVGLGIAGALIGGAIIGATQPYGYYGYPGYYGPAYVVPPPYVVAPPYVGGDEVAYCQQRFQSYDPYSGTYLGFDGLRHPCP
jgi:BA14K-like protein